MMKAGILIAAMGVLTAPHAPAQRKLNDLPTLPGYITLKGDFHIHTVFSDGEVWPTFRVDEAAREGIDQADEAGVSVGAVAARGDAVARVALDGLDRPVGRGAGAARHPGPRRHAGPAARPVRRDLPDHRKRGRRLAPHPARYKDAKPWSRGESQARIFRTVRAR